VRHGGGMDQEELTEEVTDSLTDSPGGCIL